jgi:hypothetical protein
MKKYTVLTVDGTTGVLVSNKTEFEIIGTEQVITICNENGCGFDVKKTVSEILESDSDLNDVPSNC